MIKFSERVYSLKYKKMEACAVPVLSPLPPSSRGLGERCELAISIPASICSPLYNNCNILTTHQPVSCWLKNKSAKFCPPPHQELCPWARA